MRYIILVNSLRSGGAERQISYLVRHLSLDSILTLEQGSFYDLSPTPVINLSSGFSRIFFVKYIAIIFRFIFHIHRGDVVVSFSQRSNYINALLQSMTKHTAILSERTTPSRVFLRGVMKIHRFAISVLYPLAKKIISNSHGVKNDLVEHFNIRSKKIAILYNTFDHEAIIKNIQRSTSILSYAFVTIGRLDESKGHWHLLRLMSCLKKARWQCSLAIIGDGKYRKRLLRYACELGLTVSHPFANEQIPSCDNADIIFLGIQHNPFQYVAQAKLFVLTSLYEGFPNVVVESMICGTPVMSADCRSGPREILAPNTDFRYETKAPEYAEYGILMPVFDGVWRKANEPLTQAEQIWADEIIKVLRDKPLLQRYSELGKQRAQDFSVEKIIPQWEEVIKRVEK